MAYQLEGFAGIGISTEMLELLISEHRQHTLPRLETLWRYFRNPLEPRPGSPFAPSHPSFDTGANDRPHRYRSAQEVGLPPRLTGAPDPDAPLADERMRPRREIVIENDIAWRIQTMIDFMLGEPVQILSTAPDDAPDDNTDPARRRQIERLLDAVWEASGGIAMLQDAALLGHVFGHVDFVLRLNEPLLAGGADRLARALDSASTEQLARMIRVEIIDPRRGIPIINTNDYRVLDGYVIHFDRQLNEPDTSPPSPAGRWRPFRKRASTTGTRRTAPTTEVIGPGRSQVYDDGQLIRDRASALLPNVVPVVHIQNLSQPLAYPGLSEVEPLIPLQDELNTRLSDRASRVTMQSFKMYLAKRLDGFERTPIGPGLILSTDDPDASIETFGGDAASPSETEHIEQIREAMDKISAVPPLAGGVIRARIGNLSSATALRVTLLSLLSKTARKRVTYGRGIAEMSRMILAALDRAGAFRTEPSERGVRLVWPEPQPGSPREEIDVARGKLELGVPAERVLGELGYAPTDPGIA